MVKRPHYIILGIVVLLTVGIWKLPNRIAAQCKRGISSIFLPLFGLSHSTQNALDSGANALVPRSELNKQIEQLRKENLELRTRAMQWEEAARENARFRQYFGWPKQYPWKLKLVRVIGRDPANWWHTIRIDAGTRDGVVLNSPVLTVGGLVGRVSEVSATQAQVALLGDPDCRVAVMIEEPPHEHGVIAPSSSSPLDHSIVDLGYLSRGSQLKAGQRVITSGLGGIFPAGIVVGQIIDFRSVDFGLYTQARVKLAVELNTLEEVWVKLP